jgi:hypothetical protein
MTAGTSGDSHAPTAPASKVDPTRLSRAVLAILALCAIGYCAAVFSALSFECITDRVSRTVDASGKWAADVVIVGCGATTSDFTSVRAGVARDSGNSEAFTNLLTADGHCPVAVSFKGDTLNVQPKSCVLVPTGKAVDGLVVRLSTRAADSLHGPRTPRL